jgi:hypothetical protein
MTRSCLRFILRCRVTTDRKYEPLSLFLECIDGNSRFRRITSTLSRDLDVHGDVDFGA